LNEKVDKLTFEVEIKKSVLLTAGEKAYRNCIFYSHTNTLAFNWLSYDKLTEPELTEIISKLVLPAGVKIETKER